MMIGLGFCALVSLFVTPVVQGTSGGGALVARSVPSFLPDTPSNVARSNDRAALLRRVPRITAVTSHHFAKIYVGTL